jgi:hypothetical protein
MTADLFTRSGGRCPSMKVLMLMMTFSPMSMRPSMVADPMCGNSTTLSEFDSELRIDRRLVFEHVEAGACKLAGFEHADQAASSITSPRAVLTR